MSHQSKLKHSQMRNSSSTAYFSKTLQVPFRTVLKRRNDTISSSQLYEDPPVSKQKTITRHLSHSQILSQKQIEHTPVPIAIKDFVKKMGNNIQQKKGLTKIEIVTAIKNEDDRLSQKSSRSIVSSSHIFKKEATNTPKEDRGTLEQLQKRVQTLIGESLGQFQRKKSTIGIQKWLKTELCQDESQQKELEQLIAWMKELSEKQEVPRQKIDDLTRKITMIEKLLAREHVEAEMMQGMYFNWKTQRGNTTSFLSKSALQQSKKYNKTCFNQQKQQNKQISKSKQIVSKYDSTNSASFKHPSKQYYLQSNQKKNSYSANRQPLQRSSYSAQYLNYGQLNPYIYKADNARKYPQTSLAVKASTYQQEYKEKLGILKKIDFRELDCYQDKFQNPKISFMNSSKKQSNEKKDYRRKSKDVKENIDAKYIKKSQESLLSSMNMSSSCFFKSEHQKEYFWHNNISKQESKTDLQLKSQIKDNRLQKFKESFRALAMKR